MHLKPNVFRIGFIGVDIFYVLSGFLMTKILCEKKFSTTSISTFYLRRFKRIVPLYLLVVLATYIYGYFALLYPDRKQIADDLLWVCTFTSNCQPIFEKLGYWDQLSTYRFFVHTWSLAVELQYYAIVPIIIGSAMLCSKTSRLIVFVLLVASSLCFQLRSEPKISYGFLLSRIWQFMCGSIAYQAAEVQSRVEDGKSYKPLPVLECDDVGLNNNVSSTAKHTVLSAKDTLASALATVGFIVLTGLVIASPQIVTDHGARIASTFIAAAIIFLDSDAYCFTNKVIVYCGDISYVLYLVHWPIIVAVRYHYDSQHLGLAAVLVVVLLSFGISIGVHHSIEQFFMSSGFLPSALCVLGCYIYILMTVPEYVAEPTLKGAISNTSKEYAIKWNLLEDQKVYYAHPCKPDRDTANYTGFTEEPQLRCVAEGKGTAKILLIGNSIAYRAYPLIHNILEGRYKTFRLYSRSSCPPLSNWCAKFSAATRLVVEHEMPDILMNIHHTLHPPFVAPFNDSKTDRIFNEFQSNVNFFSNFSKHIVIDMPYYKYPNTRTALLLAKRLQQGLPPGDDLVVTWKQYINQTRFHRQRIASIECDKCIINDVAKVLFHDGLFYTYDPKTFLARLGDGSHMTPVGLELLRPLYKKILDDLLLGL